MLSHCRTCQPLYLRPETRFFLPATLDPMRPPLYDGNRYCTGAATIELKSCEASLARHWRRIQDACGDAQTGALEFIETQIRHARSTKRCVGSSRPRFNLPSGRRLLKGGRVARVARAEPGLKLMLMPAPWVAQVFKEKSRPADHGVASNWIYLCSMKVFS